MAIARVIYFLFMISLFNSYSLNEIPNITCRGDKYLAGLYGKGSKGACKSGYNGSFQ